MATKTKNQLGELSRWLIGGSIAAIILAGIGYLGQDIWLASTQWLIIAAVLAIFGIYTKLGKK